MKPLIGIYGKKGSGKDTVGELLENALSWKTIAVADAIKEAAKIIFLLSDDQVYGDISVKETLDPRWDMTPRHILQQLGTEVGRNICPEVWNSNLRFRIEQGGFPESGFIVTDIRLLDEAELIRNMGGIVIRVDRPDAGSGQFEEHRTETEQDEITPDFIIDNDGNLEALLWKVMDFTRWLDEQKG